MQIPSQETRLFREERLAIHKLLSNNPNYFGTATGVDFPVVQPIKFNTTYEELTCVGLWPERNLLEATIRVKLPFGFLGEMCSPGSYEYVRFFIDWDNDGDFSDFNEDVGVAAINVHDIPQVREFHLCYAVRRPFRPFLADCRNPYAESAWSTPPLNGRFTVRLRVRHQDLPHVGPIIELYDAATVWLDNRDIQVDLTGMAITGGAALDACQELSLSQFLGTTADIVGRAWDPLIPDTEPSWLKPNDNFDHYAVDFAKDGGGYVTDNIMIPNNTLLVPNELPALPAAPNDVGVLATWDIVSAPDAGPPPSPYVPPPYPKIYRGERCAYIIHLFATDNTVVSEGTTHHGNDYWPFCIVNDLPLP